MRKKRALLMILEILLMFILTYASAFAANTIQMEAGEVKLLKDVKFLNKTRISSITSSSTTIAGVNTSQIFAKKPGKTKITVQYKNNKYLEFYVNVSKKNIVLVGHRGDVTKAPENTMAAFKHGYTAGYRAFECDIFPNAKGDLYLTHDTNLYRLTRKSINIKDLNDSNIAKYPIVHGVQSKKYGTQYITRVKELFAWLKKKQDVKIYLHIRSTKENPFSKSNAQTLAALIKKYNLIERAVPFVLNRDTAIASWLRGYKLNVGYINRTASDAKSMQKIIEQAKVNKVKTVIFQSQNGAYIPLSVINKAHYYGIQVGSYSVNNKQELKKYTTTPADFVICNRPVF